MMILGWLGMSSLRSNRGVVPSVRARSVVLRRQGVGGSVMAMVPESDTHGLAARDATNVVRPASQVHRPGGHVFRWTMGSLVRFMMALFVGMLPVASAVYRPDFADEHYYAMAAIRVSLGERPYFDHVNVQSPLHSLVGGALLAATGTAISPTGGMLLRLLTAASEVVTLIALAGVSRRLSSSSGASWVVLLALAAISLNISWTWYGGLIQNTSLSMAFFVVSLLFMLGWLEQNRDGWRLMLSGLLAGLSISTRLQMAPMCLALACALFAGRDEWPTIATSVGRWAIGAVVGLVPLAALWVQDPSWVYWCLVQFHVLSGEARELVGYPTSWEDTFLKTLFIILNPTHLAWTALLVITASGIRTVEPMPRPLLALSVGVMSMAFMSAIAPTTTHFYHILPISISLWLPFSWVSARMDVTRLRLALVAGTAMIPLTFSTAEAKGGWQWRPADVGGPTVAQRWEEQLEALDATIDDVGSVESLYALPLVWLGRRPKSVRVMGPFLWLLGNLPPARAVELEVGPHRDAMNDAWEALPPTAVLTWVSAMPEGRERRLEQDYLLRLAGGRGWVIDSHIGNWVVMKPARGGPSVP